MAEGSVFAWLAESALSAASGIAAGAIALMAVTLVAWVVRTDR
jgi:hypothetical protein